MPRERNQEEKTTTTAREREGGRGSPVLTKNTHCRKKSAPTLLLDLNDHDQNIPSDANKFQMKRTL